VGIEVVDTERLTDWPMTKKKTSAEGQHPDLSDQRQGLYETKPSGWGTWRDTYSGKKASMGEFVKILPRTPLRKQGSAVPKIRQLRGQALGGGNLTRNLPHFISVRGHAGLELQGSESNGRQHPAPASWTEGGGYRT